MSGKVDFKWETEAEAKAFIEGIEYANDSALTLFSGPMENDAGCFVVVLEDEDEDREPYRCDNCERIAPREIFEEAKDLSQRIDPGGVYTDKECPDCGALAYPIKGGGK